MSGEWNSNERDGRQRSYGFVGLSALVHASLLASLLFAPKSVVDVPQAAAGQGGQTSFVDMETPGNSGDVAATEPVSEPTVSASSIPVEQPAAPVEVKPEPAPELPVVEIKKPKKVAILAKPKTHGLPNKKRPAPKQPARPNLPESEPKIIATEDYQPESIPAIPPESSLPENLSPEISDTDTQVPSADETMDERAQEAATSGSPAAAVAPSSESAAPAAASASATTAPSQSSSAQGPKDGPSGTGTGYGAPFSNGTEAIDSDLRNPVAGNPRPVYPTKDRLNGVQGTTVLLAQVRADGTVGAIAVAQKSGSASIDQSAINAFSKWKYAPGREVVVRKVFAFQLTGNAQQVGSTLGR